MVKTLREKLFDNFKKLSINIKNYEANDLQIFPKKNFNKKDIGNALELLRKYTENNLNILIYITGDEEFIHKIMQNEITRRLEEKSALNLSYFNFHKDKNIVLKLHNTITDFAKDKLKKIKKISLSSWEYETEIKKILDTSNYITEHNKKFHQVRFFDMENMKNRKNFDIINVSLHKLNFLLNNSSNNVISKPQKNSFAKIKNIKINIQNDSYIEMPCISLDEKNNIKIIDGKHRIAALNELLGNKEIPILVHISHKKKFLEIINNINDEVINIEKEKIEISFKTASKNLQEKLQSKKLQIPQYSGISYDFNIKAA